MYITRHLMYIFYLLARSRSTEHTLDKRSKEISHDKYFSSHDVRSHNSLTKRHHDDSWDKGRESDERRGSKSYKQVSTKTKSSLENRKIRCFNCQKVGGHLCKDCPLPKATRCRECGSRNHLSGECKIKTSRSMK